MITFNGKQQILYSAEMIERKAHNVYPHISPSKIKTQKKFGREKPDFFINAAGNLTDIRENFVGNIRNYYPLLINCFKNARLGNCDEEARLAELIGRINGQKNIRFGKIYIKDEERQTSDNIKHGVAFISDLETENGKEYFFKNKEAIIIDPWLGITDFAGSYFAKIKTIFRKSLPLLKDDNLLIEFLHDMAQGDIKEYNKLRKSEELRSHFSIKPSSFPISDNELERLKFSCPELVIKDFKVT